MDYEKRIFELESKTAYLENYVGDLNSVVIEQERVIKKITGMIEDLKKQIAADKEPLPEGEKPPHY